jgi:hypothetical protein
MAQAGRKSLKDELGVLRRYADLSESYFKVLKAKLESDVDPAAQMWAVEQLTKAFVKMIPQTIAGEGDDGEIILKLVSYGNNPTLPVSASNLSTPPPASD